MTYVHTGWYQRTRPTPVIAEPVDTTLLLLIVRTVAATGSPPRWEAMLRATGRSREVVHKHLRHLRTAGLITWTPGAYGSLRPTVVEVPFHTPEGDRP